MPAAYATHPINWKISLIMAQLKHCVLEGGSGRNGNSGGNSGPEESMEMFPC